MREMKDSEVEWIGEIPKNWNTIRLKICVDNRDGGAWGEEPNEDENDTICLRIADFDFPSFRFKEDIKFTKRNYSNSAIERLLLKKGDILIEKSGGGDKVPVGRAVIFDKDYRAVFSNFMDRIRIKNDMIPKYFLYMLFVFYSNHYIWNYIKQTTGIQNLDITRMFSNERMPMPERIIQSKIVDYLDSKCSLIDSIIVKQEAVIEKLKEYKLSIITEAVTKGVNPYVELKDSKNPIIGNISKNFRLIKLKYLCNKIADGTHFSPETVSEGYPYITATDISGRGINYSETKKISEKEYLSLVNQGCRPRKGDVLIVKDGATTGRVGLMIDDTESVLLSSVAMLHPSDGIEPEYLMYLMMSRIMQQQITISMAGSAMPRTTLTKLMEYVGIYMPYDEQKKVIYFLNKKVASIDSAIKQKNNIAKALQDYKKSLIYEVVTGKKEV